MRRLQLKTEAKLGRVQRKFVLEPLNNVVEDKLDESICDNALDTSRHQTVFSEIIKLVSTNVFYFHHVTT